MWAGVSHFPSTPKTRLSHRSLLSLLGTASVSRAPGPWDSRLVEPMGGTGRWWGWGRSGCPTPQLAPSLAPRYGQATASATSSWCSGVRTDCLGVHTARLPSIQPEAKPTLFIQRRTHKGMSRASFQVRVTPAGGGGQAAGVTHGTRVLPAHDGGRGTYRVAS